MPTSCLPAGPTLAFAAGAGVGSPRAPGGDVVDALDEAFYAPYEGDGRRNAPYEPDDGQGALCLRDGHILLVRWRGSWRRM